MAHNESMIQGRWRIVETDMWDQEALDTVVPAYIRFDRRGMGEMQLIAIDASIDYRVEERDDASVVQFTWAGFDEGDPTSGRAWARIDGDTLRGTLFIHQGDESTFVATRERVVRRGSALNVPRLPSKLATPARRGQPPLPLARQPGKRPDARRGAVASRAVSDDPSDHLQARSVYQFNIALQEIAPPIWRTIQVPGSCSFWDLHVAIQDSMGWLDYHLHLFHVKLPGSGYAVPIGIPDEDAFEGDEPILPGWEIPIARYFVHPGAVAQYEYDFGDGWEHELTLEAIVPRQKGLRYPRCLAGERACPPEDCGGVGGYENLFAVMGDPSHEEYASTLQWLGGRFEPERFNARAVKFDDPAKRWNLAFGKSAPTGRRAARRTSPKRGRK